MFNHYTAYAETTPSNYRANLWRYPISRLTSQNDFQSIPIQYNVSGVVFNLISVYVCIEWMLNLILKTSIFLKFSSNPLILTWLKISQTKKNQPQSALRKVCIIPRTLRISEDTTRLMGLSHIVCEDMSPRLLCFILIREFGRNWTWLPWPSLSGVRSKRMVLGRRRDTPAKAPLLPLKPPFTSPWNPCNRPPPAPDRPRRFLQFL